MVWSDRKRNSHTPRTELQFYFIIRLSSRSSLCHAAWKAVKIDRQNL